METNFAKFTFFSFSSKSNSPVALFARPVLIPFEILAGLWLFTLNPQEKPITLFLILEPLMYPGLDHLIFKTDHIFRSLY